MFLSLLPGIAKYGTVSQYDLDLEATAAPNQSPVTCIVCVNREGLGRQRTQVRSPPPSIHALPPPPPPLPRLTPTIQARAPVFIELFPFEPCFKLTNVMCPTELIGVFIPGLQEISGLWSRLKETWLKSTCW